MPASALQCQSSCPVDEMEGVINTKKVSFGTCVSLAVCNISRRTILILIGVWLASLHFLDILFGASPHNSEKTKINDMPYMKAISHIYGYRVYTYAISVSCFQKLKNSGTQYCLTKQYKLLLSREPDKEIMCNDKWVFYFIFYIVDIIKIYLIILYMELHLCGLYKEQYQS